MGFILGFFTGFLAFLLPGYMSWRKNKKINQLRVHSNIKRKPSTMGAFSNN
jgi:hypothetical protein